MYALVIDDSKAMRSIVGRILTKLGYRLLEAGNGRDGLALLHKHGKQIDIVVVDWNMPVMNGLEFVKEVRADKTYEATPIMMCTTESHPAQMARAMLAGVDEFLMKPFSEEEFVAKIDLLGAHWRWSLGRC